MNLSSVVLRVFLTAVLLVGVLIAGEGKKYGKELTLKEETKISTILADVDNYVGKKVLIRGRIVDVCKKRGCWIELASDKEYETIQIKVKDGEIVFPMEIRGKLVLAEGVVEKVELDLHKTKMYMLHQAEENGETVDTSKVEKPLVIYRISGLGAEVQE